MKKILCAALCCSSLIGINNAHATVLTFDDINPAETINDSVPNVYGGLDWSNINFRNSGPTRDPAAGGTAIANNGGYANGRVSGDFVGFNVDGGYGIVSSASDFTFNGAYFTAAWQSGLNIRVQGYENDTIMYSKDIIVNYDKSNYFNFNFVGINKLYLSSFGGKDNCCYNYSGTEFAIDNFTVSAVPVPGAVWLLGSALVGLMGFSRRKSTALVIAA